MSKANIGTRMLMYRAKNRLSQRAFAELIGENFAMVYRTEKGLTKPHCATEIRLCQKMDELEAKEGMNR